MTRQMNWAGNVSYTARAVEHPASLDELQRLVASEPQVRALGSRHSFNSIADCGGVLVCLDRMPGEIEIDSQHRQVSVGGGVTYGVLAEALQADGWALANLASLPHITVAGAIATGTHGSGDRNQCLSAAVSSLDLVGPDGALRRITRRDAEFDATVVALGALGIVARLTLDIEPTYDVWQATYADLPWETLLTDYEAITRDRYSVSVFTRLGDTAQVWVKQRGGVPPEIICGARRATRPRHILPDGDAAAATDQSGAPGPWFGRLPHFRMDLTPSSGAEIQSEYLLPREELAIALTQLRDLAARFVDVLQMIEIRSVAADDLWLSPAHDTDVVGLHFTWRREADTVAAALGPIEEALLPLGARPHWGKAFTCTGEQLESAYPRLRDFAALRERIDPTHVFGNAWLDTVLPR